MNYTLLQQLCAIHAPSGSETQLRDFLIDYVKQNQQYWKVQPQLFYGDGFQDALILVFGKPKTAIYAHMDSIGFTVRYNNELLKIGGPVTKQGFKLMGTDSLGPIECELLVDEQKHLSAAFDREIERGTTLTFKPDFRETAEYIQCCYMDNRLGIFNALQVAPTLEKGAIAFGCWEEHGKGSAAVLGRFLYKEFGVMQSLISDITWVTDGVLAGKGVAISLRDSGLPRRSYVNRIVEIAKNSAIPYQLEVEGAGGSDGNELQATPYPIDWCFVGAPEDHVHSPNEKVHKADIAAMIELYKVLMLKL